MFDSSKTLLNALTDALASHLSPARWDLTIEDAVADLARVAGDPELVDALLPIAPLLAATSSGVALDLAYGAPGAPQDIEHACAALADEIVAEWSWLAENSGSWATDADEVRQVVTEFERLVAAMQRLARALR